MTMNLLGQLEQGFKTYLVDPLSSVLFYDLAFYSDDITLPFIVVWLIGGAAYLTFKMGFINIRAFKHAIDITRGKYDNHNDPGEISHFQALSSALSGTVGLGNIAGVAIAISLGGPGAVLWMIVAGFLGMSSKMVECSLALKYRHINSNGQVLGGPMCYISSGFSEKGYPRLAKLVAMLFAIMCIGGSLGGGNMFQANQAYAALAGAFPVLNGYAWLFGILMAVWVGIVIIGGIKRIGVAAGMVVPVMCLLYLLAGMWILIDHINALPQALMAIGRGAFSPEAGYGGVIGVMVTGFRRSAFSNEAGMGSSAIAHSAASTNEPIREGIVALLEPFIDTIIVCTMSGLIMVVSGAYLESSANGILMMAHAFGQTASWLVMILSIVVLMFAYSTMISWSYYGERCWSYLFATNNTMPYKILFVIFVFLGSVFSLGSVLDFSDLMILGMGLPNIFAIVLLSPAVKRDLDHYWQRYQNGHMKPVISSVVPGLNKQTLSKGKA